MKKEKSAREQCVHCIKLFGIPHCTYGTTEKNLHSRLAHQHCSPKDKCPLEENEIGEITMQTKNQIIMIPISRLEHHPKNPRKSLGDLTELSDSIKAKGILQNLTVVPVPGADTEKYYVVIGNRRLGASKGVLTELPCIVSDMNEEDQVATMLLENMQRSDLTVYEQAEGFKQLRFEFGKSIEDISEKTGFSESTVRRRLKLAELDKEKLKEVCEDRQITIDDALKVCEIKDESARNAVLEAIGTKNFDGKLYCEMEAQKRKDKVLALVEEIKKFAPTELENRPAYDDETWRPVKTYYIHSDEKIENPDFDANFAYFVGASWVSVYADNIPTEDEDEDAEEKQKKEQREAAIKECVAECNMLADMAHNRRTQFVKNLKIDKPMLISVNKWALEKADEYSSSNLSRINKYSKNAAEKATKKQILAEYETDPYKLAFLIMFARYFDDPSYTYIAREWSGKPEYCDCKALDTIYELLSDFGYEISDDEAALMDGTHPIFEKNFLEGIEE